MICFKRGFCQVISGKRSSYQSEWVGIHLTHTRTRIDIHVHTYTHTHCTDRRAGAWAPVLYKKVSSLTLFLHLQSFYSYPLWEYPQYTNTSSFGPTHISLLAHNIIFHLFCTNRNKQTDSSHAWS